MKKDYDLADNYTIRSWFAEVRQARFRCCASGVKFPKRHIIAPAILCAVFVLIDVLRFGVATDEAEVKATTVSESTRLSEGPRPLSKLVVDNAFRSFGIYWLVAAITIARNSRSSPSEGRDQDGKS